MTAKSRSMLVTVVVAAAVATIAIVSTTVSTRRSGSAAVNTAPTSAQVAQRSAAINAATDVNVRNIPAGAPARPKALPTTYCDSDPEHREAVDLIRSALLIHQTFNVAKSQSTAAQVSDHTKTLLTKAADEVVLNIYESAPSSVVRQQYDAALSAAVEPSFRAIDGGVANFSCRSLKPGSSSFSITATSRTWATIGTVKTNGAVDFAQPANDMIVTATVTRSGASQSQKISSMAVHFASGSGP